MRIALGVALVLVMLWDTSSPLVVSVSAIGATLLFLSGLKFARLSAQNAIEIPALTLESVNKWTGRQRSTWVLRPGDNDEAVTTVAEALRTALGEPMVAIIQPDGTEEETVLDLALNQSDQSYIAAWADGASTGSVAVRPTTSGVWLRVDPQPEGRVGAVIVADCGEHEDRMRAAVTAA